MLTWVAWVCLSSVRRVGAKFMVGFIKTLLRSLYHNCLVVFRTKLSYLKKLESIFKLINIFNEPEREVCYNKIFANTVRKLQMKFSIEK